MVGKRHQSEEIVAKLKQAEELVAKGKTQRDIAAALGVSVMTYHRWRKMPLGRPGARDEDSLRRVAAIAEEHPIDVTSRRMADEAIATSIGRLRLLEEENGRLRRLVTDLLLEKVKLEDEMHERYDRSLRRAR